MDEPRRLIPSRSPVSTDMKKHRVETRQVGASGKAGFGIG